MGTVTYKKTTYMLIVLEEGSIYKLGGETFEFTGEYDYVYDALGRTTSETLKNGSTSIITKTFTYLDKTNSTNLIESEEFSNGSIYIYEYDALNRLTAVKENGTIKLKYTYDAMGRLAREDNAYANKTYVYEYTTNGNISAKKTYAYTTGTLGAVQSTETRTYGNSNWIDQLTNINGTTITYDEMGNPLSWHNASLLTWEGRKLKTFTKTDGTVISYTYDENGIRTGKTVGSDSVRYILDGNRIIQEKHTDYTLTFIYDDSNTLIGLNYDNGTSNADYYYGIDIGGNINYIYNSTGTVVVKYGYDAWGKILSTTGTLASTIGAINPYRYKSYYYDTEIGLYNLQSRYYDASVQRFLSADDAQYIKLNDHINSHNYYSYCNSDPINNEDISGFGPWIKWLNIVDYYWIHKMVADRVAGKVSIFATRETFVWGSKGNGRLDVYDPINNAYYEVKSYGSAYTQSTRDQMIKYDNAKAMLFRGTLKRGNKNISGSFYYGAWHINYYLSEPGLVVYKTNWVQSRYETAVAITTIVILVGITASVIVSGGATAPAYSILFVL